MALIHCNTCGKEISDTAAVCPHCGQKTRYGKTLEDQKNNSFSFYIAAAFLIIGVILFFPSVSVLLSEGDSWYFWNWNTDYANSIVTKTGFGVGFLVSGGFMLAKTLNSKKK